MTTESLGKRDNEGERKRGHYDPLKEMAKVRSTIRGYNEDFETENGVLMKKKFLKNIADQLMRSTRDEKIIEEIFNVEKEIDSSNNLKDIQEKMLGFEGRIFK